MLHAAIYAAEPGSVIVVQTGNLERAVAGGNVCRVAQRRGIVGLVVDGLVRDVAELRAHGIAVYARGVVSAAGAKDFISPLNVAVYCGGVCVNPGDVVVADEDGIVVLPCSSAPALLADALAREAAEATESLDAWEDAHRSRIGQRLRDLGSQTPQIGTR
jgi:regulator of RNase E activity RraA